MIGDNITSLRKQRGLTLSELAERTGISKSYLSNIERNLKQNPSIHIIEKLSEVLKVDLKVLVEMAAEAETKQVENEWLDFIHELKQLGIEKDRINEYKILFEFMKWYNDHVREEGE
ncbi:helix-turn-helix domain-containing protein [Paenibacillus cremeus]|uniref:Helix-turn-helix transcriptional regulator n=1 Tax=Paenibacillus cremeus TaxID=2163881 RepID=A0A559K0H3_9BACL|nr:helix-turn-helix transcriptional regulator [Paenibacillus cremeus]TVY05654.1 helix-turn-helix transcriptional regulator [Paenibacillus cremeus]